MHRLVLLLVVVLIISATTVAFAKSDNANSNPGRGQGQSSNSQSENRGKSASHGPSAAAQVAAREATPSAACDPNANWKNHGEYVSCVARLHLGGQTTSQAARSNIGKKGSTPSASLSPSPSASGSASPSATPEATSSATVSIPEAIVNEAKGLINNIVGLLARLQELLSL